METDPSFIASLGLLSSPLQIAAIGLLPVAPDAANVLGVMRRPRRKPREEDEAFVIAALL